jgi:hypothetical protein
MPCVRVRSGGGREFTSVREMQAAALVWCAEVAGRRAHRSLAGAAPATVFAAVEAAAFLPLSARRFVLATWSTASVGPDIHAEAFRTIYSVPWRFIGQRVDARETFTTVQLFHKGQLLATHGRKPQGKQTDLSHYPAGEDALAFSTGQARSKRGVTPVHRSPSAAPLLAATAAGGRAATRGQHPRSDGSTPS